MIQTRTVFGKRGRFAGRNRLVERVWQFLNSWINANFVNLVQRGYQILTW